MSEKRLKNLKQLFRYSGILVTQAFSNPDYFFYWLLSSSLAVAYFETVDRWAWLAIGLFNGFVGILAVGSVVRFVDRAFLSLGLPYEKTGYGEPTWIVKGYRPFAAQVFPIRAAGFAESDFERHLPQLSSRLCQPIETIRKPSAERPVIEVVMKRSKLPSYLDYRALPLEELRSGEFYIGQTDKVLVKAILAKLPHILVAGSTGTGKTTFIQQLLATILSRTTGAHVCMVDMKSGIDFQPFLAVPSFELTASHEGAKDAIDAIENLYELRKAYLFKKKKQNWTELSQKELASAPSMNGKPIGPVLFVVDELAELVRSAKAGQEGAELQESLASFARRCRYAGIHLVLGTQRPDKKIMDMQGKDNCPARVCFSVPSVAASTLVVRDMSATTLGSHPGRAVYQLGPNQIVQTPHMKKAVILEQMGALRDRLTRSNYARRLMTPEKSSMKSPGRETDI